MALPAIGTRNLLLSLLCILFIIIVLGCENPFDFTVTPKKDYLQLESHYNLSQRIVDTLSVKLDWSEITLVNFMKIEIERLNKHRHIKSYPPGIINGWVPITTINNDFILSFVDIVNDDAPFEYRLRYFDKNNNYIQSSTSITIRPTTHVFVPDEFDSIEVALDSYILDNGDTIIFCLDEFSSTFQKTLIKSDTLYTKDTITVIGIFCD